MEIHQLRRKGFLKGKIARKLDIARNTVYSYLQRAHEEMTECMVPSRNRKINLINIKS
ncbi:terminase gpP N-terminus-related DNA-binding protein [Neobacillus jeddahensis]|uniref:terminase gpP N-terminus-related DNA-binding protein n=1 Tax=Neobacillus jeddahensis TaxID=1461580 RepID=UPI001CA357E6